MSNPVGGLINDYGGGHGHGGGHAGGDGSHPLGGLIDSYGHGKQGGGHMNRGYNVPAPAPQQHHGGGGVFGFVGHLAHEAAHPFEAAGHWVGEKASLAGHDIAAIPGGTYHLFKPLGVQAYDIARYGPRDAWGGKKGEKALEANQRDALHQTQGVVNSAKQSLEHPLRDPFQTAMTVSPLIHAPFRIGEIARGVDITAPRTLRMGEAEVGLPKPSGNAAIRAAQGVYDRTLQHALDTNPEGRIAAHAAKRIGGSLTETARYQARMREVPAQLLQHAGRELRGAIGKKIPFTHARAAEAALRLTSENSTAEEAARFHHAQAAKGIEPKANTKLAKLYEDIHKSGLLKQDEHGNVVVNAAKAPKLAEADAALARAQLDAERIVHEHNLMSEEGQRARLDAPAAIRAGKGDVVEAQARLAELDKHYEALLHQIVPHVSEYANRAAEQLRRNFENSRAGKGRYRALTRQPTVKEEELALAEERLHQIIEDHPHAPGSEEARQLIEERQQLIDYLNRHGEASMFGEPAPGLNGTAREGRGYVPYKAIEEKASRSPVARASGPVVGKTRSPIPSTKHFTGESLAKAEVPDATTELVARHLRRLYRFVNTDTLRRKVLVTGSDVKRSSREILVRIPDKAAGPIPTEIERDLGRKHVTLDELAQLEGHKQALADHMDSLVKGGYDASAATNEGRLAPALSEGKRYGIGQPAPRGYMWVDRNVFGDLGNSFALSRGRMGRFGDAVNSAVTTATVYLKPGHLPQRTLTNLGTNLIQGSAGPRQLAASVRLWRGLSHEDRIRALGAAGQGGYEAMPHDGEGLVGRQATKAAHWWSRHVDAPFRFASIAYEARKAGYTTQAEFRRFLSVLENPDRFPKDEALRADAAAKEANRAGIAYDRMSDAERRTIARMVWFYPWIRNAALYTGRAFLNHPYKGSLLAQLGVQGRKEQQSVLGDLPSYEFGLTPVGHNKVSDISRLFPFSTAADLMQLPAHPGELSGNANPALSALLGAVANLNSFGSQAHGSHLRTALGNLFSSLPETQIIKGLEEHGKDQSRHMFPNSGHLYGAEDPLLRALFGPAFPRTINPDAAHSAAAREKKGG